jgi:hypothetical protein
VAKWANALPALVAQDEARARLLLQPLDPLMASSADVRDTFYHVLSQPMQTACAVPKRLGGQWMSQCGALDGEKLVCMDSLMRDIREGKCLVYSFGVADDWSFEDTMGALGCTVRAFDPTIDAPQQRSQNVSFHKLGISHFTGTTQVYLRNMFTRNDQKTNNLKTPLLCKVTFTVANFFII